MSRIPAKWGKICTKSCWRNVYVAISSSVNVIDLWCFAQKFMPYIYSSYISLRTHRQAHIYHRHWKTVSFINLSVSFYFLLSSPPSLIYLGTFGESQTKYARVINFAEISLDFDFLFKAASFSKDFIANIQNCQYEEKS